MKLKNLHYDLAIDFCNKRLKKNDYGEYSCVNCPLCMDNSHICFLTILYYLKKYGDKEFTR